MNSNKHIRNSQSLSAPFLLVKDDTRIHHLWNHIYRELWHCPCPVLQHGSFTWLWALTLWSFLFPSCCTPCSLHYPWSNLMMVNNHSLWSALRQNFHLHSLIWHNFPRCCYSCLNKLFPHLHVTFFFFKFLSPFNIFSTPSPSAPRKPMDTSAANLL